MLSSKKKKKKKNLRPLGCTLVLEVLKLSREFLLLLYLETSYLGSLVLSLGGFWACAYEVFIYSSHSLSSSISFIN